MFPLHFILENESPVASHQGLRERVTAPRKSVGLNNLAGGLIVAALHRDIGFNSLFVPVSFDSWRVTLPLSFTEKFLGSLCIPKQERIYKPIYAASSCDRWQHFYFFLVLPFSIFGELKPAS